MSLGQRADRIQNHPGILGRWCAALRRLRDDLRRTEQESVALAHKALTRLLRWFFEGLILIVVGAVELDTLRRRAAHALSVPPRR